MEIEKYKQGIEKLLERQDITAGVRSNLEDIDLMLLEKEAIGRGAARRLRRKVGEVVLGQHFAEPPLPELLRELGTLTQRRHRE